MDINLNANVGAVARATATPPEVRPPANPPAVAAFDKSQALTQSLESVTAARPDVVARAKELVSSSPYPPPETIRKIAVLLAINLKGDSSQSNE